MEGSMGKLGSDQQSAAALASPACVSGDFLPRPVVRRPVVFDNTPVHAGLAA
jgi:hypothetical protein